MRISFSKVSTYLMCGELYRRVYECRDIRPPGMVLLRGRSFHRGAAKNFKQKKDTGKDMPKFQIIEKMDATFDYERRKDGCRLTREEQSIGKNKVLGQTRDCIRNLGEIFADRFAPSVQPEWVEEKKVLKLADADIELVSVLDLATRNKEIIEMKTASRNWSQQKTDIDMQLTFESLMFRAITGEEPARIQLAAFVAKSKPDIQQLYTRRTIRDYQVLTNVLNRAMEGIQKGIFLPCERGHWKCNPKYCGFWYDCQYVNQERLIYSIPKTKGGEKGGTRNLTGPTSPGNSDRGLGHSCEGRKLPDSF